MGGSKGFKLTIFACLSGKLAKPQAVALSVFRRFYAISDARCVLQVGVWLTRLETHMIRNDSLSLRSS